MSTLMAWQVEKLLDAIAAQNDEAHRLMGVPLGTTTIRLPEPMFLQVVALAEERRMGLTYQTMFEPITLHWRRATIVVECLDQAQIARHRRELGAVLTEYVPPSPTDMPGLPER